MSNKVSNAFELIMLERAQKRLNLQNLDKKLFPTHSELHPKPSTVMEISADNNNGKTHLLKYIAALCVIPENFKGKHGQIIFIDLKNKFDTERFLNQIKILIQKQNNSHETEIEQIAMDCLSNVILLKCYSTDEFMLALEDVENILVEDEQGEIILIAIDGLDAFYWLDVREKKQRMRTHYAQIMDRLRSICMNNNICAAFTVNKTYLEAKRSNAAAAVKVDYKFFLDCQLGTRTLNGNVITIDDEGFTFH